MKERGNLFWMYNAYMIAQDQYSGPKIAAYRSQRIILARYLFSASAIAFFANVSEPIISREKFLCVNHGLK